MCGFLSAPNREKRDMRAFYAFDYAHRGLYDNETVPENSLPAFRRASEGGFGIELDVRLTKDGRVVVFHDDDLARVCGQGEAVSALSWEALQAIPLLGTGERIPSFEQALSAAAGAPLIVELKPTENAELLAEKTLALLRGYRGLWCVESFHPMILRWFRKHAPDVLRGQLAFGVSFEKGYFLRDIAVRHMLGNFLSRPDFVAYHYMHDQNRVMRRMREKYRPTLVAWTVISQSDMDDVRSRYDMQIFEGFLPRDRGVRP